MSIEFNCLTIRTTHNCKFYFAEFAFAVRCHRSDVSSRLINKLIRVCIKFDRYNSTICGILDTGLVLLYPSLTATLKSQDSNFRRSLLARNVLKIWRNRWLIHSSTIEFLSLFISFERKIDGKTVFIATYLYRFTFDKFRNFSFNSSIVYQYFNRNFENSNFPKSRSNFFLLSFNQYPTNWHFLIFQCKYIFKNNFASGDIFLNTTDNSRESGGASRVSGGRYVNTNIF